MTSETQTQARNEPWDHPYDGDPDWPDRCIHCGFVGSYAHTEEFYRKWVWPALPHDSTPGEPPTMHDAIGDAMQKGYDRATGKLPWDDSTPGEER